MASIINMSKRGPLSGRERSILDIERMRAQGYRAQGFGISQILSLPFVGFLILVVLFGPIVLGSFMKILPGIPLNIWIVGIVILFVWKWLS